MIGIGAVLATVLGATGCAHGTTATSGATAAPRASSVPRRITGPRSMNVPGAAATPRAAVAPARRRPVAATAAPHAAAGAMPQILGASVSPGVVGSGTVVHATVRTTAGVVTVVANAGGVAIPVPRIGPGLFAGSTTIPPLPPFVHGSYPVTFVARDARGASTQSAVGVSVR